MPTNFAQAMFQGMDDANQSRLQRQAMERQNRIADLSIQKSEQGNEDRRREQLVQLARGWKSVPQPQKQAYYDRFVHPAVSQMGFGDLGQYDEAAVDGVADQILAAYGNGQQSQNVHSAFRGQNGNMWVLDRSGQVRDTGAAFDPNNQIIDTGNGFYGVNKTNLQAAPVTVGQAPQQAPAQDIPGVYIDPSLPPAVQSQIRASVSSGQEPPSQMYFPSAQAGGGEQLRSTPKPDKPSELEQRIGLARQMGATEDDIRKMIIGREGAAAGAKPIPPQALSKVLEAQEALGGTRIISDIISKHAGRIKDGTLVVGPVDSIGAQLRTRLGMSNAQDVNLNEWEADKTKIVNESLRLNKGVQTEGDAQRAVQELMGANDPATASRALLRLAQLNKRAVELQQQKLKTIYSNYGRAADGEPLGTSASQDNQAESIDDLLDMYR